MFDEVDDKEIDLIELVTCLYDGIIELPIVKLRNGVVKQAKKTNFKALKKDHLNILGRLVELTRNFCLHHWKSPNLLVMYHIWDELVVKMEILNLILEPLYNGQIGVKFSGFKLSNDWNYKSNIHLTEIEMVIYKTFYDIFLKCGTSHNDQINKLLTRGLESFWKDPKLECCWIKFEQFCSKFQLVSGGEVSCLKLKRDLIIRSITQFHRKPNSPTSILVAIESVITMNLKKSDEEIILKSMIRVNSPQIVQLLSENIHTSFFNSILQIYIEFNWDQEDFNLAIDKYVLKMLPSFEGINERSSKSITQLISKCLEISISIQDQFNSKDKYYQVMIRGFDKFQRNFSFHLSKFIINQLKVIIKISNRNEMENQWDKFILELKPLLKIFKSSELITLTKNLTPPMSNLLLYDFNQFNESTQFNLKDCLNSLIPLLGDETQLQYTVKQIMDGYDQLKLFKNEYPGNLIGDIICCKSNQFDDIKNLPIIDKLELPNEIKQPLDAFIQFNGKGEIYWDLKKFKFQLQFGGENNNAVIHCNYNHFKILMKFNDCDSIPCQELGDDLEALGSLVNSNLLILKDNINYVVNESISGIIRLK